MVPPFTALEVTRGLVASDRRSGDDAVSANPLATQLAAALPVTAREAVGGRVRRGGVGGVGVKYRLPPCVHGALQTVQS